MELTNGETSLNESSERNFDVSSALQKPTRYAFSLEKFAFLVRSCYISLINRLLCYRLDPSVKEREEKIVVNPNVHGSDTELMSFQSASPLEVSKYPFLISHIVLVLIFLYSFTDMLHFVVMLAILKNFRSMKILIGRGRKA